MSNKLIVSLIVSGSIFCPNSNYSNQERRSDIDIANSQTHQNSKRRNSGSSEYSVRSLPSSSSSTKAADLLDSFVVVEPSASQAYGSHAKKTAHYRMIFNSNEFKTILKQDLEQTISKEINDKFINFEKIKCFAEANNVKLNFDAASFIEKTKDALNDIENLTSDLPRKGKTPLNDDELLPYFEKLKRVYDFLLETKAAFAELIFDLVKNVPIETDFIIEINKTLKNELALFFKVNQSSKIIFNEHYPNHEKIMENFLEFRNAFFNKSSESIEKDCYVPFLKEKQKEIDKMMNGTIDFFKEKAARIASDKKAADEAAARERETAVRIAAENAKRASDKKADDETAARIASDKKHEEDRVYRNKLTTRARKVAISAAVGTAAFTIGGGLGYGAYCALTGTATIAAGTTITAPLTILAPITLAGESTVILGVGSIVGGTATTVATTLAAGETIAIGTTLAAGTLMTAATTVTTATFATGALTGGLAGGTVGLAGGLLYGLNEDRNRNATADGQTR